MRFELQPRTRQSLLASALAPVVAIALTMAVAVIVLWLTGYDALAVTRQMFLDPLLEPRRWPDLGVKAAPLALIGVGLAIGFRANVWNIGAEGQFIFGAIAGTGVALLTQGMIGPWILPAMLLAGVLGGMAWAAIPALLKTRAGVSEILVSLMLTYVAIQLLYYLVRGPWKDPAGFNFPQTIQFGVDQTLPMLLPGTVLHAGVPVAVGAAIIAWLIMRHSIFGFAIRVVGEAPLAARHGGFSAARTTWAALLAGGGLAGLAGMIEAAGPFGQLTPQFPQNYGFTAIIVAFLGRLNPLGIVLAALALAVTYVGGDIAQSTARLPQAATGVFQALMLFILIATDALAKYHIIIAHDAAPAETA